MITTIWDWWVTNCAVIVLAIIIVYQSLRIRQLSKEFWAAVDLLVAETDRKRAHAKAFEKLTDVNSIVEDMERGADVMEARNANRLAKPREDAGPPAKVYRPTLRSKLSRPWTPPTN